MRGNAHDRVRSSIGRSDDAAGQTASTWGRSAPTPKTFPARQRFRPGGLSCPVWDCNAVAVSPARDPANRLYFTLSVDGIQTFTNVWAHGVDARTYFPYWDKPEASCVDALPKN